MRPYIEEDTKSIEAALELIYSGRWFRLSSEEQTKLNLNNVKVAWRIALIEADTAYKQITYLVIGLDNNFPLSQPKIICPEAILLQWPHIESQGLLCLKASVTSAEPDKRVLAHLRWAIELLGFSKDDIKREFEREFSSYWANSILPKSNPPHVISLLERRASSRIVRYYYDAAKNFVVVADDIASLKNWLRNSEFSPSDKELRSTFLIWLARPWQPNEYPKNGLDALKYFRPEEQKAVLQPGQYCPIFFGCETKTGVVFVATILKSPKESQIVKGFRSIAAVPFENIRRAFAPLPLLRCRVERADGQWVHGRDHDPSYKSLANKKICVIGLGSLGSAIAKLIAQAGVKDFIFIDPDTLHAHNVSRHIAGQKLVGINKAKAVAKLLSVDFPNIKNITVIQSKFGGLTKPQLEKLQNCDLIISAGIDFEGDAQIDAWRNELTKPPVLITTWAEAYALCGHVIAVFGKDNLLNYFENEAYLFRLSEWPLDSNNMFVEAGCGNSFQPHGSVSLQFITSIAAKAILDVLNSQEINSFRIEWLGDKEEVIRLGGQPKGDFDTSYSARTVHL